jgi:RNA-binding protein YlmH
MIDKKEILKKVTNSENKILISKVLDKAEKAIDAGITVYTEFLDPYQQKSIESILSKENELKLSFFSGYSCGERAIAVLGPQDGTDDFNPPLNLLQITLKSRSSLTHRDFLGSLMGLGIKREKIGDIIVKEEMCSVVVMQDIAEYISINLSKVGNTEVHVEVKSLENLIVPEPKVKEIKTTIASLRLDSVASAGYGMSRSKMVEFIKAEKVSLNWEVTNNASKQVKEGDTISIRGKGRVLVKEVGGTTKKGRTGIILEKYI